jgi:hypothetical protein
MTARDDVVYDVAYYRSVNQGQYGSTYDDVTAYVIALEAVEKAARGAMAHRMRPSPENPSKAYRKLAAALAAVEKLRGEGG